MTKNITTQKFLFLILIGLSVLLTGCKTVTTIDYTDRHNRQIKIKHETDSSAGSGGGGTPTTNREVKEENEGRGAGDTKIDLNKSNINFGTNSSQISITLTAFGTPVVTNHFPATITNNILSFSNPSVVDAWADPYLDGTHGMILESFITTVPVTGPNTVVAEIYLGDKILDAVSISTYIKGGTGIDPIEIF